ncbi:hypothetical protein [Mycobacterium sp. 852002-40037_SCH5390672]|uniref:hypothetical protein n=1 Tax=Mycobacterium sp. 852002-40037_SCH5390672 TaxID=1834089 RepID=UPI000B0E76F7|nr:hypothetical protein [Mycobacterium sp. 852002-40037_SCH5390672]
MRSTSARTPRQTLHDTGDQNGRPLDPDVVNVLIHPRKQVSEVTAHLTDIGSFDAYFS